MYKRQPPSRPVRQRLRPRCFGVSVVRCTNDGDINLGFSELASGLVNDGHTGPAVIEKQLLACHMDLTHRELEMATPFAIEHAKLWVAIT